MFCSEPFQNFMFFFLVKENFMFLTGSMFRLNTSEAEPYSLLSCCIYHIPLYSESLTIAADVFYSVTICLRGEQWEEDAARCVLAADIFLTKQKRGRKKKVKRGIRLGCRFHSPCLKEWFLIEIISFLQSKDRFY